MIVPRSALAATLVYLSDTSVVAASPDGGGGSTPVTIFPVRLTPLAAAPPTMAAPFSSLDIAQRPTVVGLHQRVAHPIRRAPRRPAMFWQTIPPSCCWGGRIDDQTVVSSPGTGATRSSRQTLRRRGMPLPRGPTAKRSVSSAFGGEVHIAGGDLNRYSRCLPRYEAGAAGDRAGARGEPAGDGRASTPVVSVA